MKYYLLNHLKILIFLVNLLRYNKKHLRNYQKYGQPT